MKKAAKEGGFLEKALAFATGGLILKGVEAIGSAAKDMFTGAIDEAREAKRGMAQLEAVLTSTGGAAGITKKEALDLADSLSAAGGLSTATDDAVLAAENMLLTFTNIKKNVFPGATKAALDMATAMNNGVAPSLEDLQGKSILVGKALNDPIKGITSLTRVGVTFSEEQKKMIKALVDTGDTAGAQNIILAELNKEFGGSAEAAAKASGGMAQLEGKMDNLKQGIGEALLPVMDGFVSFLNNTALPAVEGLMGAFTSGDLSKFQAAISTLPGPIQAIVAPLGDVVVQAGKFFKAISSGDPEQVLQFWRDLGGPVGFVGENLTKVVMGVTDFFKGMSGEGSAGANAFWTNFNTGVDTANKGLVVAQTEGSKFWQTFLHTEPGQTPADKWINETLPTGLDVAQTKGREFWTKFLNLNDMSPGESPAAAWMRNMHEGLDLAQTKGREFWTKFLTLNDMSAEESPAAAWMRNIHEGLDLAQTKGGDFWQKMLHPAVGQTPAEKFMENLGKGIEAVKQGAIDFWNNLSNGAKAAIGWLDRALSKIRELINLFLHLPGDNGGGGGGNNNGQGGQSSGGYASGGYVKAGGPYLVGERGPELFMPNRSGTIIPNHRLGGGGMGAAPVVNVHIGTAIGMDERALGDYIAELLYDRTVGIGRRG